jgi:hemolysin III
MKKALVTEEGVQSLREEIANSVSSGIGLVAIIGGIPFLLGSAIQHGTKFSLAGAIIFAATMVSLYLSSTIYHALPRTKIKRLFRLFDHSAIFLLIAGTYTPFALGALRGVWGWTLFGLVWSLAILGIGFKALGGLQYRWLSTCLYVGMGWMAVFAIHQFWLHIPLEGLLWITAGGLAYTTGVAFYLAKRIRYGHFVWHLFVTAGTACHFCAVLWYAG